jgi:hypothetical protein
MVASYEEFAAEHRAQHRSPFIRWSAVVGNYSLVPTAVALLLGRPRVAAAIFGFGTASLAAGHIAEGNLFRGLRDLARHPVWGVRADFAVENATMADVIPTYHLEGMIGRRDGAMVVPRAGTPDCDR